METRLGTAEYVFCDPCYVVSREMWDQFLDKAEQTEDELVWRENGEVVIAARSTAYGDGSYPAIVGEDRERLEFGVDSGTLGVVNLAYCLPREEWPPASDYHVFEGPARFVEDDGQFMIKKGNETELYAVTGQNQESRPRM